MKYAILVLLLPLGACAAPPGTPTVSVDDIMRRQYAAGQPHGAMSGSEASAVTDAYAARIGALTPVPESGAPKADAVTGNDTMKN